MKLPQGPPPTPKYARDTSKRKASEGVPRPHIVLRPIPFDRKRKREMAAYAARHYGIRDYRLVSPQVIVVHYTETGSVTATYDMFAPDHPDPELHELPNVCSHFVVDTDGTIFQLVPLRLMCRHTVGLNDTAIGVEHVGRSDAEVLGNERELRASLALVRWLRCTYGIRVKNVIGHNESLKSPFHRERVKRLAKQTHDDFVKADMDVYRRKLRAAGGC